MKLFAAPKVLSKKRILLARALAAAVDVLQIAIIPAFGGGFWSPLEDLLDLAVGVVMVALLGWHWLFLPTFISELIPGVSLVPTWTAAVFLATRRASAEPLSLQEPKPKDEIADA